MGNICNVIPLQETNVDDKANAKALCVDLSGNPIIFEADSAIAQKLSVDLEPIQDLHGYANPWVGGAGKNILPVTLDGIKSLNTSGTWSGNVYTLNNVEYTVETNDGGNVVDIKVNGTASASGSFRVGVMQASGTLKVVGCPQGGDFTNGYSLGIYRPSIGTIGYDKGNGTTFEFNGTSEDIRIVVRQGTQCNNLIFKPMVSTDTTVTYATAESYTNICPISGRTETGVKTEGRNLFDENYPDITTSIQYRSIYVGVGTFTMSTTMPKVNNGCGLFFLTGQVTSGANNDNNGVHSSQSRTITSTNGYVTVAYRIHESNNPSSYNTEINRGDTVLPYTPYMGNNSASLSFGQTVYGCHADYKTGKVIVDRVKETFDWSEGGGGEAVLGSYTRKQFKTTSLAVYPPSASKPQLSSVAPYMASWNGDSLHFYVSNSNPSTAYNVNVYLPTGTTSAIFDVCYELATPIELQLTPAELELLKGYNYITADGNINISLVPENVIDYVMGQIISAMGTNESGRTTASRAYSAKEYFYKDGKMYKCLTSIASGATFTVGTNCAETTIFAELTALNA